MSTCCIQWGLLSGMGVEMHPYSQRLTCTRISRPTAYPAQVRRGLLHNSKHGDKFSLTLCRAAATPMKSLVKSLMQIQAAQCSTGLAGREVWIRCHSRSQAWDTFPHPKCPCSHPPATLFNPSYQLTWVFATLPFFWCCVDSVWPLWASAHQSVLKDMRTYVLWHVHDLCWSVWRSGLCSYLFP